MLYYMDDKKVAAIMAERAKVSEQIETIRGRMNDISVRNNHACSGHAETAKLAGELDLLTIRQNVLGDNLKMAIADRVIPVITQVYNKYAGKKFGPKTKDKIRDELIRRTNCHVYIDFGYTISNMLHRLYINVQPLNEDNLNDWRFPKIELAYTAPDGQYAMIDNTIQFMQHDLFTVLYCGSSDSSDSSGDRAAEIMQKQTDIKEAAAKLNSLINEYNSTIAGDMRYVSSVYITF